MYPNLSNWILGGKAIVQLFICRAKSDIAFVDKLSFPQVLTLKLLENIYLIVFLKL